MAAGDRLASIAARTVGRRVQLTGGHTGTVTRVTGAGLTVKLEGVTADDVEHWLDD